MAKNFVTDVTVLLAHYRAVASTVLQENLSWYSVLNISHKVASGIKC